MTKFKFQGFLKENGLKLCLTVVMGCPNGRGESVAGHGGSVAGRGGSVAGQGSRGRPGSGQKFKLLSTFQPKFEK